MTPARADDPVRGRAPLPRQRVRVRRPRNPAARPRDGRAREDSRGAHRQAVRPRRHGHRDSRDATAAPARRFFHAVLAVEALSRVDPSIGVLVDVQNTLVINALLRWGNDEQQAALPAAAGARHGRRLRAVGSRLGQRRVRADDARRASDGDDCVLTGRKLWITNANEADVFIVFATVNPDAGYRGITAFIVERGFAGLHASARRKTSSASARAARASCSSTTAACRARTCSARSARATRSRSRR